FPAIRRVADERPVIRCPETWMAYWSSRSPRLREELRRSEESLAKRGEIRYERYRPEGAAVGQSDPRWDLYELFESFLSTCRAEISPDKDAATRTFLRDVHSKAAEIAGLDVNVLWLDRRPITWCYNYRCD